MRKFYREKLKNLIPIKQMLHAMTEKVTFKIIENNFLKLAHLNLFENDLRHKCKSNCLLPSAQLIELNMKP